MIFGDDFDEMSWDGWVIDDLGMIWGHGSSRKWQNSIREKPFLF